MTKVIFRGEIQNQANFGFSQVLFMTHAKKKYLKMNKTCICHLNLAEKESKYYNIFCYISECVPRLALVSQNAPKLDRPYDFRILS